jgi:SAM-dependent methyltransferase
MNLWDEVYAKGERQFHKGPNAFLMEVVRGRTPGKALDIGMGQGRNAFWLAGQGWDVTGVESSAEALRQAREEGSGVAIVESSIEEFDLGAGRWDLIAGIYVHGVMLRNAARIIDALRPGGILVVEGFHRDVMDYGATTLDGKALGFQTNALLRHFLPLRIERYEDTIGFGDWQNRDVPVVRMLAHKPPQPLR